ncbi:hypothetical protein ACWGDE_06400 [Streptomyces sp. NPDC054956]
MSALKWQGWLVALVFVAGLLVFAPLGLYVWAGGAPAERPAGAAREDVRITDCRIDPASRRVVATTEATNHFPEPGSYVVTVEFRAPTVPELTAATPPASTPTGPGRTVGTGGQAASAGPGRLVGTSAPAIPAIPGRQVGTPGPAIPGSADPSLAIPAPADLDLVPVVQGPQALVKIPGVRPGATERAEALGPVWPAAVIPWCGIAAADFAPAPPFARSLGLGPRPHANPDRAGIAAARQTGPRGDDSPAGV